MRGAWLVGVVGVDPAQKRVAQIKAELNLALADVVIEGVVDPSGTVLEVGRRRFAAKQRLDRGTPATAPPIR